MVDLSLLFDFALGGASAGFSKTLIAPIERVKLLLQLQDASHTITTEKKYKGAIDCFQRIYKEQGFRSYWRGNLSNVIRYFPGQAISFSMKDLIRKKFPSQKNDSYLKKFSNNLFAGGAAGSIAVIVGYPLDFIRTRLAADVGAQKEQREFLNMRDVVSKIYKSEGITGIFRGISISVVFAFVYRACYFGIFDSTKEIMKIDMNQISFVRAWLLAQVSTLIAGQLAYPFDTVRRRLMMQSGRKDALYLNSRDCFRMILKKEGVNGFYKGAVSNMFRGTGAALALAFYNKVQAYLGYHSRFSE
jgi:solute carrier family 25 (adenine nucleotide translocator) protein 4/5/6/31